MASYCHVINALVYHLEDVLHDDICLWHTIPPSKALDCLGCNVQQVLLLHAVLPQRLALNSKLFNELFDRPRDLPGIAAKIRVEVRGSFSGVESPRDDFYGRGDGGEGPRVGGEGSREKKERGGEGNAGAGAVRDGIGRPKFVAFQGQVVSAMKQEQ